MNKKILLSLGGVAALSAAIVAPIMLVPNSNSKTTSKDVVRLEKTLDVPTASANVFNPSEGTPIINPSNAIDYLVKDKEVRDPNKWYSTYRNDDYEGYDPEMAYKFAAKYGWTMSDYTKYVHYHYETTLDKKLNQFGTVSGMIASSWIAFHPDSGLHSRGGTAMTFWPGHESPTKPTYDGSEQVESNHVDNDLTWYGYKDSMGAFVFDENNLGNAFKRLTDDSFKRLEYAPLDGVKDELGTKNVNDALVSTKRSDSDNSKFIMVNGKLKPFDWFYENGRDDAAYYYITANDGTYIRDENGWKVIVSPDISTWDVDAPSKDQADEVKLTQDQVYDKLFTTVLNPINSNYQYVGATPDKRNIPVNGNGKNIRPEMEGMHDRFNNSWNLPEIHGVDGQHISDGSVAQKGMYKGQANFTDSEEIDYGQYTTQNISGLPKATKDADGKWDYDFKDISVSAQGVYKLAYKEKSWLDLVANRSFVMTYQYYASPGDYIVDKNRQAISVGDFMWEGGDMNWMWDEDGQGGHKIWKKINILTPRTWEESYARQIIGANLEKDYHDWKTEVYDRIYGNESINPNHRFWANYNHVFWNKISFEANPDASKDGGY